MQPRITIGRGVAWAAIALLTAGLVACGGDEQADAEPETESPEMIAREAPEKQRKQNDLTPRQDSGPEFQVMPPVEGSLENEGMGLETVINAGTKDEYAQSLQWIAEDTSREQFDRLETAIRYIHMYDPAVFGNDDALYGKIDGMTGTEVIAYADRMIEQRQSQQRDSGPRTEQPVIDYDN